MNDGNNRQPSIGSGRRIKNTEGNKCPDALPETNDGRLVDSMGRVVLPITEPQHERDRKGTTQWLEWALLRISIIATSSGQKLPSDIHDWICSQGHRQSITM